MLDNKAIVNDSKTLPPTEIALYPNKFQLYLLSILTEVTKDLILLGVCNLIRIEVDQNFIELNCI